MDSPPRGLGFKVAGCWRGRKEERRTAGDVRTPCNTPILGSHFAILRLLPES